MDKAHVCGVGPGSQPVDDEGGNLEFMELPKEMVTYAAPILPEKEDASGLEPALALLGQLVDSLECWRADAPNPVHDLAGFNAANLAMIDQALGEGEVSIISGSTVQAQESVLAGIWRVRTTGPDGRIARDQIEVGGFPAGILAEAFLNRPERTTVPPLNEDVFNAPALLVEIDEHISACGPGVLPHVINLSLLPHTEGDLLWLIEALGEGQLIILSRGYGNCRVTTTGTRNVWWVRFYNSTDDLILNTIEITPLPEVVVAAPEDIKDSHERLVEILKVYQ